MSIVDYPFEVPTPYSLSQQSPAVLVWEQIIPNTDNFYTQKRQALESRFNDTGIGNPDVTYWVRCMRNKYIETLYKYDLKFKVFEEYRLRMNGYSTVDLSDGSEDTTSTVTTKNYDPPDVASAGANATKYLDAQDTVENTYHRETHGGTEPDSVRNYIDAIENPFEEWVREFDDLFYWGM